MCVALTWWERGWLMEKGGQRKREGVDLRVTAATEDDSGKAQLGSYSDACCIQNNTITCNHSLNCYPGDWKTSWWKTIKEDQNKGLLRVVAHWLLIEGKKNRLWDREGRETGKGKKEADPTRPMGAAKRHTHTTTQTRQLGGILNWRPLVLRVA